jgi:hypothetical protein
MMSMTRLRAKSIKEAAAAAANANGDGKVNGAGEERVEGASNGIREPNGLSNGHHHHQSPAGSEDRNADASPYEDPRFGAGKKKHARRARTKPDDDRSLVKLASTEDLLGRRMHGLAGGLTGLQDDPE